jgi:DNA-binding response OmpR family regulator
MTIASILVVDDDESSRSIVVSALRDVGHFVRESRDFGAALVEVEQSNPDLMILVSKPADIPDLLAPVGSNQATDRFLKSGQVVTTGGITIDNISHRVTIDDTNVSLAPREYRLLLFFLTHQNRVYSREQLLAQVWDRDSSVGSRTVDVHIRRLRRALEPFGYGTYIQTVRGSGYRFSADF